MTRLTDGFPPGLILTDGAWGTELQKRGLTPGMPADLWNLSHPEAVAAVARAYVAAGSRVILTNTFRANPVALAEVGAANQVEEINRLGVHLSRVAADPAGVRVFASLGPIGQRLGAGEIDAGLVSTAFRLQAATLARAGADALVLETFSDLAEARLAVRAARETGLPVIASFTFATDRSGQVRTLTGSTPEQVAQAMTEESVSAVGANCGAGPGGFTSICRRLKDASGLPIWIKPNAGLPTIKGGRAVYRVTPEAFAAHLPALTAAGATFLGGCCGTDPDFLRALTRAQEARLR